MSSAGVQLGKVLARPGRILAHRNYNEYAWAYFFLAPSLVFFTLFMLVPVVASFILSFQRASAMYEEPTFVGLYNFVKTVRDPIWPIALKNTVIFTVATVPVRLALALLLAVLIRPLGQRLQGLFRGIFYLPSVTSAVILSLIWLWIYYPTEQGLANYLIGLLGIPPQVWFGNTALALPAIIFMVWMTGEGAMVVLYGAAMQNIPVTLYEAADIDCASGWAKFTRITWPLIKPTTLYALVTATIGSFQVFDIVYTMTLGGPGFSTRTLVFQIWTHGFRDLDYGFASAQAVLLALVIAIVSVFQFRYLSTDVEY
jgi:multiple sugar transport system permease protein